MRLRSLPQGFYCHLPEDRILVIHWLSGENKLLYADLERIIKGKPFMEFRTKKVETLLVS